MTNRPDHVWCIAHTHADRHGLTWCGRLHQRFTFTDIDHATYNAIAQGRSLTCPDCLDQVVRAWNRWERG